MKRVGALAACCLFAAPPAVWAACSPFTMQGWYAMPAGPGGVIPATALQPMSNLSWSFQNVVPPLGGNRWFMTRMHFQDKNAEAANWNNGQGSRNSYFVLGAEYTLTNRKGEEDFYPSLQLQPGLDIGAVSMVINNQLEAGDQVIVMVQGWNCGPSDTPPDWDR